MGRGDSLRPALAESWREIVITTALLSLPALFPTLFSWLYGFAPAPVFFFLYTRGRKQGSLVVGAAFCLGSMLALLAGSVPVLFLSFSLVPVGYLLERNARQGISPIRTWGNGAALTALVWLLLWLVYAVLQQANPYQDMLAGLQEGLEATRLTYEESANLGEETREEISAAFQELGRIVPTILPGLLLMAVLTIGWLNLITVHWLLARQDRSPWPPYRNWRLPDQLVWGIILAGLLVLTPWQSLRLPGLNLLLVFGLCYFFQGLAILSALLNRWSVPPYFRAAIYFLITIQVYGLFMVAMLGMADIWADLGKIRQQKEPGS